MQSAFSEPAVVFYAVFQKVTLKTCYVYWQSIVNKSLSSFFGACFNILVAVYLGKVLCMVDYVLTVISVLRKLIALFVYLHIAYFKRCCEFFYLVACIVDVKFPCHFIAYRVKNACKGVTYSSASCVAYVHWTCRVCGYKFNKYPFSLSEIRAAVVFSLSGYLLQYSCIK